MTGQSHLTGQTHMTGPTHMAREIGEAPDVVARLIAGEGEALRALGRRMRARDCPVIATCARGSSDHAAGYLKYLFEIMTGTPVASIGPAVASIYHAPLRLERAALVTISQSGRSPDLVALQDAARKAGALAIALVNVADSPVAQGADVAIPLGAGPETSVAATKSFVASCVAAAGLAAGWTGDAALWTALQGLPERLAAALEADWSAAEATLAEASSLYVLGRGPAFPIALEAALKAKEVAALHAEAFSTAEVMHGPLRLVQRRFPVFAFAPDDEAAAANSAALERLIRAGADVTVAAGASTPGRRLACVATGHRLLDPLPMILGYYRLIETVCRRRDHDPDRPPNLAKVTETI